ncbi:MAG TPA: DUF1549 domain-containing protein [Pirellulaceae bacterium]|jgi:WD40 repeat protein/mono/diheme cytochrome c family protein|nr:DUF1549 domain-containing protein [Pirellulaceae bacterium]
MTFMHGYGRPSGTSLSGARNGGAWATKSPAFSALALLALVTGGTLSAEEASPAAEGVSFYRDVRPIVQASCQGCHQPSKAEGEYDMTSFAALLAPGESTETPIVPGKPEESYLLSQIAIHDGKAAMPKGKDPLRPDQIELVKNWIAQGARDDTPADAQRKFDAEHPPVYTRPMALVALDASPTENLLAVGGLNEVFLFDATNGDRVARLIGLSERIQSVAFSPDGKYLAAAGGDPGRRGEIQIWNVAERKLERAIPVTFDTLFGASWSLDNKTVAVGCTDNTVRAFDITTGEQTLYQGAHADWALDTTFSPDGSHLISVGRDMTAKLTEVATERFVDNVTSITPGALKGGVHSVVMHPSRNEIVVGGSDGVPQVYRIFRETARQIGDNANLIKALPAMKGRIWSVDVSPSARYIAAGSSLDGSGEVSVFSYDFDGTVPPGIKKILAKRANKQTAKEKEKLAAYVKAGGEKLYQIDLPTAAYAVRFSGDGEKLFVGCSDGLVRVYDAEYGSLVGMLSPAPIEAGQIAAAPAGKENAAADDFFPGASFVSTNVETKTDAAAADAQPPIPALKSLTVEPAEVKLSGPFAYSQLLVTGRTADDRDVDLTHDAEYVIQGEGPSVEPGGLVRASKPGEQTIVVKVGDQSATVKVVTTDFPAEGQSPAVDYLQDVTPVMSKMGCNAGTCHGSLAGKNGFKLSLRGYDAEFDVRALTDDLMGRRVNLAFPEKSLMLLKATGQAPHVGGQLCEPGDPYYRIMHQWISQGAKLDKQAPRVKSIVVHPSSPVIDAIGSKQQFRVVATFTDGVERDVTREAFLSSGNPEVATVDDRGLVTTVRRGEAAILVRYEGAYAAATLTVMGDRSGFVWEEQPAFNEIDKLVADKWRVMKILPSNLCTDAEFVRRVYFDLTGLPPTSEQADAFIDDPRPTQVKRDELIDKLVGSPAFVDHWTNKWADLLQVNGKFLGGEGANAFHAWIRSQVEKNVPYDQFVREILTAKGSNKENPAASYYKILREPAETMENTTHLFLGVRFNCNKCHDHPFERWTQDQYYETAAYFARVGLEKDPASADKTIGGTAVEGAKPLFEIVVDKGDGEMKHDRTGQPAPPKFPYQVSVDVPEEATRREQLAAWMTSPDNPYFARSYANRIWGYLLGTGIIEPLDDIRAGNPPSNPELLDHLTNQFVQSNFDVRKLITMICKSRTYQLSIETNQWNEGDSVNYSHAKPRRLPAEALYDAIYAVTGAKPTVPGGKATSIADGNYKLDSGFLANLGKPARESACECERSSELQLGPVMALVSGPDVALAIGAPDNAIVKLVAEVPDDGALVDALTMRILSRHAKESEIAAFENAMLEMDADHASLVAARDARKAEVETLKAVWAKEREDAVASATKERDDRAAEIKADRDKREADRLALVAKLEGEMAALDEQAAAKIAEWSAAAGADPWTVLRPTSMDLGAETVGTIQEDGSVLVSGKRQKATYKLTLPMNLEGATAIRFEAMADDSLPAKGPGRADNGNFVLQEFVVRWVSKTDPAKKTDVKLKNAYADFAQGNFSAAATIDGNKDAAGNGWAVSAAFGQTHWLTFDAEAPFGDGEGASLEIELPQVYDDTHQIGRFRISAAKLDAAVGPSYSGQTFALLKTPADQRTDAQKAELIALYKTRDEAYNKKAAELAEARKPLPPDAKLVMLEEKVKAVSVPVQDDPRMARLEADVLVSESQLTNKRLTAAQDFVWALINHPSFLFNR